MASFIKGKLKAAREAISKKEFQTAVDASSQVLSYEPENYNAHVFLGLAYLELGQTGKSEEAFGQAAKLSPDQLLAWQGFAKLYERSGNYTKHTETLRQLMNIFSKSQDAVKCAETLQKLIESCRANGGPSELSSSLELLLPGSAFYDVLSLLPPPEPTAPTSTTTYYVQNAIYNSLPVLEEVLSISEKEDEATLSKEIEKRRLRLGASPLHILKKEVGLEVWSSSSVPRLYREIINHPNTSDELRRTVEAKLLRYQEKYLFAVPYPSDKYSELKANLRREVQELIDGVVLLEVPDDLPWRQWIDGQDFSNLDQYDPKALLRFLTLFPDHAFSVIVKGFLGYLDYPTAESDDGSSKEEHQEEEDYYLMILDGLAQNQSSIFAHRICAQVYLDDKDYENAVKVAQAGLELVDASEVDFGRMLVQLRKAFEVIIATALVHLFPPKHHPRALVLLTKVLKQDPDNVQSLMGRAYVFQHASKWKDARALFHRVVELKGVDDLQFGLEAREEEIWCKIREGDGTDPLEGMRDVIDKLDSLDDHQYQQARAWWRLGKSCWDITEPLSRRKEAYDYFISSLKRMPTYAPSFTSLGIWYLEQADPPDLARASKCFQKAFELDPREGGAARRLAEGFANDREWDLVEVVARRTIQGEGGIEGGEAGVGTADGRKFLPTNAWAWKAVGVVELNKGKYTEAIQSFQVTLRAEEADCQSWARLGEAYAKSGRHVAALKALARAHAIDPEDWGCLYITGDVLRQVGQYQRAIDHFNDVLATRPDETGVLISLAQAHLDLGCQEMRTGFLGRSEASFVKTVTIASGVVRDGEGFRSMAWKVVGDALYELSKASLFNQPPLVAEALTPLARFLADQSDPSSPIPSSSDSSARFDIQGAVKGRLGQLKIGHADGLSAMVVAVAAYRHRLTISENDERVAAVAAFEVGVALARLAVLMEKSGTESIVQNAILYVKHALHQEPGNSAFWTLLGILCFEDNSRLAQHAFIRAVEQDSKNAVAWCNLGLLYLHYSDEELANHAFYRAQTLNPDCALAWVGQGLVASSNGHNTDARALFEHAVGLSAEVPEADLEFASRVFLRFTDKTANSPGPVQSLFSPFAVLDRYCQQRPTDASALHLYGLICERLGLLDLALDVTARAIALLDAAYNQTEDTEVERRYATAQVNLGRLRLAASDFSGALEAFQVALSLLPENSDEESVQVLRAHSQMGSGIASFKLDDLTTSLSVLEAAMEEVPPSMVDVKGHICLFLAQTLWALGSEEAQDMAKTQLLGSITENPRNMEAITALAAIGITNLDDDLLDAALSEILGMPLHEQLELDPSGTVNYLLVRHHLSAGRTDEALTKLNAATHIEPLAPAHRQDLATLLLRLNRPEAACSVLAGVVDAQESIDRSALSKTLGLYALAMKQGEKEEKQGGALRHAQRAVFLAPWAVEARKSMEYCI